MDSSPTFTILHVSDVQFGRNHRFGRLAQNEVLATTFDTLFHRLRADIDLLAAQEIKPQLMVVSGDLAEWGLKSEFEDSLKFLQELCAHTQIPRTNVILVPGNHDVNRALCEGYFKTCEGEGEKPIAPYWPKWKHYHSLFSRFYEGIPEISFSEEEPWTLYEIPELRIAIAATNSTIFESHLEPDHYGWLGDPQLEWFQKRLREYEDRRWFRIAVVHHNVDRGAVNDEENLRDADDFKRVLAPYVNLVLHGHTHKSGLGWINPNIPILSTGSAALTPSALPPETGNQYQIVRVSNEGFDRWTRCYNPPRWIGDTSSSPDGSSWHTKQPVTFQLAEAAFTLQSEDSADATELPLTENSLVDISEPVDQNRIKERLRRLPRFLLAATNQHRAVRRQDQETFAEILHRTHTVWLTVDWGLGKDGFLATTLERIGGPEALSEVFRLQCGKANSCDELWEAAEPQLGLSFQEFLAVVTLSPNATLIFDDLPSVIASGTERENFDSKIRPIVDFCPDLRLIFVTRNEPRSVEPKNMLALRPFDPEETLNYLKFHDHRRSGLADSFDIDRVHSWSAGLPMHLDRLLERLPFLPLTSILDEDVPVPTEHLTEPLPESLRKIVLEISSSSDKKVRQSWRLLKVLTVLRDGETFDSIKRFYRRDPFYVRDIELLMINRLLEGVSISQTATDLRKETYRTTQTGAFQPKLLRVPRQVRDHVNSLISDTDKDEIIRNSMGLFFGPDWAQGKVRLRTALFKAYGESAISTPGNEHIVARYLLKKALDTGTRTQCERLAQLAYQYCQKLHAADRFRDSLIASAGIVEALRDTTLDKAYVETAVIYAKSLRMTNHEEQAIEVLQEALARGDSFIIDDFRGNIHLYLALAHQDAKRKDEAIASAKQALALVHPTSSDARYANAIVADHTLVGGRRKTRLIQLEREARNVGAWHAANNIALQLARESKLPEESLRWLDTVIRTSKDNYNRARAIVRKATILRSRLRLSEMSSLDQKLLNAAYNYSYGQRIGNLLDSCHEVLWDMATRESLWATLVRLYRFSSLIWRWKGAIAIDTVYLRKLDSLDIGALRRAEGSSVDFELLYLERQRRAQSEA